MAFTVAISDSAMAALNTPAKSDRNKCDAAKAPMAMRPFISASGMA